MTATLLPAPRLLAWTACAGLPLLAAAGALPPARPTALVLLGLLTLVVVADALLSRRRLDGVEVRVPPLVRLTEGRPGKVDVELAGPLLERPPERLRFALPASAELEAEQDELELELRSLPPSPAVRVPWPLVPRRRGRYRLERCFLECRSRLGFWEVRRSPGLASELRVYPNLLGDRQRVAALLLRRGGLGVHAHRSLGKGRELEQLRDYLPGDGFEDIHWRATAKRGVPVTKIYQIERTQEVYAVLDCSRLAARARGGQPALESFLRAALVLGLATRGFGDLFGLVTFSDRVQHFLRARSGKAHFDACRDALYAEEARQVSPAFDELATFLRLRLRRRALLVILSDLDDPALAESFTNAARLWSRQHLVQVAMLRPPLAAPIFSRPAATTDELYEHLAGHLTWQRLQELRQSLQHQGVSLSLLEHESLVAGIVSRYVAAKQRQLL